LHEIAPERGIGDLKTGATGAGTWATGGGMKGSRMVRAGVAELVALRRRLPAEEAARADSSGADTLRYQIDMRRD
jgi:hypothetical protein